MYEAELTYNKITDYVYFSTARELWNILKPHLDSGYSVTITQKELGFKGKM